ncbi:MAG: trypsin-like peptidase domain-containing protein [Chloroflexota bacterium]
MKSKISQITIAMLIGSLLLAACGSISLLPSGQVITNQKAPPSTSPQQAQPQTSTNSGVTASLSGYETALENIYAQVNPAVVSIRVVQKQDASALNSNNNPLSNIPGIPNFFGTPGQDNNQPAAPQYSQALGSGFVWNADGYIVTNNHVVNGANKIEVKFADGTTLPAKLIGTDPDSDLAVIKVDNPGFTLTPITLTSATTVKVGQVAVAIGNPFGLENTMTVGIVSALGRTLPSTATNNSGGPGFSIPDIIQTDASINPGNSGGPLVDDQGGLIGVNSAIESSSNSNSGVGFAIPATIVSRVIPELIANGKYEHPYVGISGTSLTPDIATAMKLAATQRGALVEEIVPNGPADKAGLKGSDRQVTIDGQDIKIGGDVITAFDGTPVKTMDDLIAYLADHTDIGQKVTLTVLRAGKDTSVNVTLEARPAQTEKTQIASANSGTTTPVWLGIAGQPLTPEINKEMNLTDNQTGILVEQVQSGSPADQAGMQGSFKPVLINGQRVLIGGDVITAIDGTSVANFDDLQAYLQNAQPGQQVKLTILRDGKEQTLTATLAKHP